MRTLTRWLREYMRNVADGVLVHGPLLGWAQCQGYRFEKKAEL